MLPDMTPAVARALQAAQRWARGRQSAAVMPGDVLAGLLEEEEGQAATLLVRASANLSRLRQEFGNPPDPHGDRDPPALPLDHSVQQALARARELAAEHSSDRLVHGPHLLLALFRGDEALVLALTLAGSDLAKLEAAAGLSHGPPLRLEEPLDLAESTEQIDTARILDASANRAREALRVIEDHARFALDDAFLCGELKRLRHDLTAVLAGLPGTRLLEARETQYDVGTVLSTLAERQRHSLLAVARANWKRLQEALRSLEEHSKLISGDLGQALEQLRYRSYTLERAVLLGADARHRLADARLYVLLSGSTCTAALDWTIQEAAAGGAQVVQLREKHLDDRTLLERARQVQRWTRRAGVLFIVNDRPDIARLAEADGVHLGQDDLPVKEARRIVGPDLLIGVSTHNLEQLRQAVLDGANYLGVGPTFPSGTKTFTDFPGLPFVRQATAETSLPAFVLGGVHLNTIAEAVTAGARRVAVSQAIAQADDPHQAAMALRRALDSAGK
jgi:thiamine-phosphate pyrophosphorylase